MPTGAAVRGAGAGACRRHDRKLQYCGDHVGTGRWLGVGTIATTGKGQSNPAQGPESPRLRSYYGPRLLLSARGCTATAGGRPKLRCIGTRARSRSTPSPGTRCRRRPPRPFGSCGPWPQARSQRTFPLLVAECWENRGGQRSWGLRAVSEVDNVTHRIEHVSRESTEIARWPDLGWCMLWG